MRLTWNDKLTIEKMLKQGYKAPAIARYIGCTHKTIYDEIKRGSVEVMTSDLEKKTVYAPEMSQARIEESKKNRAKELKIGKDRRMAEWLVEMIAEKKYSPAAVCSMLGKTEETTFSCTICRQTLYKYIDRGYLWPLTNKNLRYKQKERNYNTVKRASRPSRGESIERRPDCVNMRTEPGHWEMDCVEGTKGSKRCLLVMTERASRYELIIPMRDQTCASVVDALDRLQRKYENFREMFKTITVDNGAEFMDLEGMEKGGRTKIYYCHPRYPGERGSNEKQNQIIRWWFPKGTNFSRVDNYEIKKVQEWINNYPRLALKWETSATIAEAYGLYL